MSKTETLTILGKTPTRRQLMVGAALAAGSLATGSLLAQAQQDMTEAQSTGAEALLTYLHQEIEIKSAPQRIYDALLDSKQFTTFSGFPAEISREAGGVFPCLRA